MALKHKNSSSPTLIEALEVMFQFTEADLRSNRRRILSDAQRQRMLDKHKDDANLARLAFIFFAVIGFAGSGFAALQEGIPLLDMWSSVVVGIMVIGLFIGGVLAYSRSRLQRTLKSAEVHQIHGSLSFTSRREGKTPTFYLCVDKKEFLLTVNGYYRMRYTDYQLNQLLTPG